VATLESQRSSTLLPATLQCCDDYLCIGCGHVRVRLGRALRKSSCALVIAALPQKQCLVNGDGDCCCTRLRLLQGPGEIKIAASPQPA
jgi:hypothetical protein